MSEKKFRFVSPGIFLNEIDNSLLPRQAEDVGPVVIGRTQRGPAMRPVKVNSFLEFTELFGTPIPGGEGGDVWRDGNRTSPTYAAYAARAWLKNGSPLTVVRCLGEQAQNGATSAGEAGWQMDNAYGLFVAAETTGEVTTAAIAATATVEFTGIPVGGETIALIATDGSTPTLEVGAEFAAGADLNEAAANLAAAINDLVDFSATVELGVVTITQTTAGVAGNTAITSGLTNATADATFADGADETTTPGSSVFSGTLGAIFYLDTDTTIELTGTELTGTSTIQASGTLVRSQGDNFEFKAVLGGDENITASFNLNPASSKYIRKVFNTNPTLLGATTDSDLHKTYFLGETFERNVVDTLTAVASDAADSGNAVAYLAKLNQVGVRKGTGYSAAEAATGNIISQKLAGQSAVSLMTIHAIDSGEHANANIKISISDIKASSNEDVNPYGSFTVEVRSANDTDARKRVLETFTNCNLNPNSTDFVAAKIGDKYAEWSDADTRFIEYGDYANQSKYIRVAPASTVSDGAADPSLLPFGFEGPSTYIGHAATTNGAITGDNNLITHLTIAANDTVTLSMSGPKMALRVSSSTGALSDPTDAYFGVDTSKASGKGFEKSNIDLARILPAIAENQKETSFTFSLDDVQQVSSSDGGVSPHAEYIEGSYDNALRPSITAGGITLEHTGGAQPADYKNVLNAGFDKFTMPMVGGFDGFDVTESDPLRNSLLTGDELTSAPVNTLKRAINTISDPEQTEINLAVVPGITKPVITNHLIDTCERRADALAVIDLEGGYTPSHEAASGASVGSAASVVANAKTRALNTSYACAYHPWIQSKDELGTGKMLWLPPSIAALGTFASNDKVAAPWFAPAGFTRGGLTNGAAGIPVAGVREHLTRKMRDSLYENNINPIAKFPAEGIVIFGQKTLQASDSALDRVNVRRMMLHVKKGISRIASTLLFDQNVDVTWKRFSGQANAFLSDVQSQLGLTEYRVVLDETTTTPDLVDRNTMYAKVFLKPARSIEFIAIDFVIQKTGASFDD